MNSEFEKENSADNIEKEAFFEDTVSVDQKINIPEIAFEDEKKSKRGLKLFCILIAFCVAVSSLVTVAYYIGKNKAINNELYQKPENVQAGNASSIYQSVRESVVGIYIYNSNKETYSASGIVYTSDGYIIMTDSLLSIVPNAKFKVMTVDGTEYSASFFGGDQRSDIAVLKINEEVNLKSAVFGSSEDIKVGEKVYSVGKANGYNVDAALSDGIISGINVRVTDKNTTYSAKRIQSTVAINPADFGGALTNEYGQIIGMLSTKVVATGYEQISYAVPSVEIKNIAEQIINNGKVADRARIGISYIEKNAAAVEIEGLSATGLLVADVSKESELYGNLNVGDIITEINGKRIHRDSDVLDIVEASKVGDRITIKAIDKNGKEAEYTAKLLSYKSESSYSELPSADNPSDSDNYYEGY